MKYKINQNLLFILILIMDINNGFAQRIKLSDLVKNDLEYDCIPEIKLEKPIDHLGNRLLQANNKFIIYTENVNYIIIKDSFVVFNHFDKTDTVKLVLLRNNQELYKFMSKYKDSTFYIYVPMIYEVSSDSIVFSLEVRKLDFFNISTFGKYSLDSHHLLYFRKKKSDGNWQFIKVRGFSRKDRRD